MGRVGVAEASTTHPRISIARKANIEALKLQLLVCHSAQRAFSAKESAQLPPDVRLPRYDHDSDTSRTPRVGTRAARESSCSFLCEASDERRKAPHT